MKKFTFLFAIIGMIMLQSCTTSDDRIDYDTIAEVFEVNATFNAQNGFSRTVILDPTIYSSDKVLVYRLAGIYQGRDVWNLLPQNYFFNDGTFSHSYNFDFTYADVNIFMEGYELAQLPAGDTYNQTFRIVIIPASASNFRVGYNVNDYDSVINAFGIDDTVVKKLP
jgi:hypothetical protein